MMIVLRRVFLDGAERPELVLLHYSACPEGDPEKVVARSTVVVPPSAEPGKREGWICLPSPPPGSRLRLRYFYSTVLRGSEWFSRIYEAAVPGDDLSPDLVLLDEKSPGNTPPASGMGTFRLKLPLMESDPRTGSVRYGFGAMRKKPSPELCRLMRDLDGKEPVVEIPSALSVLKNRPMPFFLYHVAGDGGRLAAHKINCARITLRDDMGDIVCARLLWGDPSWAAQNFTIMELKNFAPGAGKASDNYFIPDREAFLRDRAEAIGGFPLPRIFEGYVFSPEGSVVEYCFQVLTRRSDGSASAGWRNRDGGNWSITL